MNINKNAVVKFALIALIIAIGSFYFYSRWDLKRRVLQHYSPQVTYRLVENNLDAPKTVTRGLSKQECAAQMDQLKGISKAIGTYDDKLDEGSITCVVDISNPRP